MDLPMKCGSGIGGDFITGVGKETAYQSERKEFRSCQPHERVNSQDIRISLTHNGIGQIKGDKSKGSGLNVGVLVV